MTTCSEAEAPRGRLLGVDYGERRLGLAVGDAQGQMAFPLRTVQVRRDEQALEAVIHAASEEGASRIVVGLPLNMDGSSSAMTRQVEAFVTALRARAAVPVVTWDERLSTAQVERMLVEADVSRKRRRASRDKLAAQLILQNYLEAQAAS
jgi:putative Holliday junction resolvase